MSETVDSAGQPTLLERIVRLTWLISAGLLVAAFFTLPMSAIRPFGEVAIADVFIGLLLPFALVLFLVNIVFKGRLGDYPKWLWISTGLLLLSIALVEVFPASGLDRLAEAFDTYGLETGSSLVVGIRVIFALVAFPIIISLIVDRWSLADLLVSFWIAGVLLSCVVAILDAVLDLGLQKAFSYDPDSITGYLVVFPGDSPRMVGLSDHPNTLSLTGVMVSPLVMARMKTRRGLMIYGPILLVIVIGVLTSGARVGVVGLALAVGLTLALDKRVWPTIRSLGKRTLVGIGLVVAAGLVLLFVAAYSPSDSTLGKMVPSSLSRMIRPSEDTRAISDRERESRIDASLDFISERPLLGYGYNWVETSHNTVLQLILAGGVAGLAGYFLGVIGYLLIGFRLPSNVPEDRRNFCFAIAISFFVYVASGVVSNFVFGRFLYMPAGLILAVHMFQLARKEPRSETSDE
jgi:hypothetical protein